MILIIVSTTRIVFFFFLKQLNMLSVRKNINLFSKPSLRLVLDLVTSKPLNMSLIYLPFLSYAFRFFFFFGFSYALSLILVFKF